MKKQVVGPSLSQQKDSMMKYLFTRIEHAKQDGAAVQKQQQELDDKNEDLDSDDEELRVLFNKLQSNNYEDGGEDKNDDE